MLDTLASLGEFLGGMAVIGGVIFAVIQLRHHRQRRRDAAAIELVHAVAGYKLKSLDQLRRSFLRAQLKRNVPRRCVYPLIPEKLRWALTEERKQRETLATSAWWSVR
jgi:hypothetical protein